MDRNQEEVESNSRQVQNGKVKRKTSQREKTIIEGRFQVGCRKEKLGGAATFP